MIVVLADDLSGAAELAGAALRHGLSAEVQTAFDPSSTAAVVCVDGDTRLLPPEEAARRAGETASRIAAARPDWIYQKCDSVLRGNVLAELGAIRRATGRTRAVVISANPNRGRVVRGGRYFVEGRLLHETAFAHDPLHPRATSVVAELLGGDRSGVATPDAASAADLEREAAAAGPEVLPVGGVDFFEAVLAQRGFPERSGPQPAFYDPRFDAGAFVTLLVCGSAASWDSRRAAAAAAGHRAHGLPHDRGAIARTLRERGFALVGIGDGPETREIPPPELTRRLAESVAALLADAPVDRLLLEGGATAVALIRRFGWTRFAACGPVPSGVGALRPAAPGSPLLLVKPGSYPWPEVLKIPPGVRFDRAPSP